MKFDFKNKNLPKLVIGAGLACMIATGCSGTSGGPQLPPASFVSMQEGPGEEYVIGPLDELTIFVWRNPELGAKVQVRPDGRITTPLITDMPDRANVMLERHICVDTTAAGGNTELLAGRA